MTAALRANPPAVPGPRGSRPLPQSREGVVALGYFVKASFAEHHVEDQENGDIADRRIAERLFQPQPHVAGSNGGDNRRREDDDTDDADYQSEAANRKLPFHRWLL